MHIAVHFEANKVDASVGTGVLILLTNGFGEPFDFDFTCLLRACLRGDIDTLVAIKALEKTDSKGTGASEPAAFGRQIREASDFEWGT